MAAAEEQAKRMMEADGSFNDLKEIERCKSLIDSEQEEELVDVVGDRGEGQEEEEGWGR